MTITDDIAIFVRTVDLGSFAGCAGESGLTASAIARIVTRLERRLGVRLLHRSTRRLVLTQEGEIYLRHARAIVAAVEAAEAEIVAARGAPSGVVRINTGTAFARHRLAPRLDGFRRRFPGIQLEIHVSDRRIDPVEAQIDVSIRVGPLADSSLIAKRIGTVRRVVAASPAYIARHGRPEKPEDLLRHECLQLTGFARLAEWPFRVDGKRVSIPVKDVVSANNADLLLDLALEGIGIVRMGDFLGERALSEGRLVEILADCHDDDPTPISLLVLPGRRNVPRVRAVIDFLTACATTDPTP